MGLTDNQIMKQTQLHKASPYTYISPFQGWFI